MRELTGSQEFLQYHGRAINKCMAAGAELEHKFAAHEDAVAKFMEDVIHDIENLHIRTKELRIALEKLADLKAPEDGSGSTT